MDRCLGMNDSSITHIARLACGVILAQVLVLSVAALAEEEEPRHWRNYPLPHGTPKRPRPPDEEFLKVLPPLRKAPEFSGQFKDLGLAIWWGDYSRHVFREQPPTQEDLQRSPVVRTSPGEDEPVVLGLWGIDYAGLVTVKAREAPFPLTVRSVRFAPRPVPSEYDGGKRLKGSRVVGFGGYLPESRTVTVEPDRNGIFWITVSPPPDAKPGRYDVTLQLTLHSRRKVHDVSMVVEVLPFKLPRAKIAYGMYFRPYGRWIGTRYTTPALLRAYCRDMARHGMTSATLYNYSKLHDGAGNLKLDGVREIEWLKGMIEEGLVTADVPIMFLDGSGIARNQKVLAALTDEVRKRGWPEFLFYGPDEPPANEQSLRTFRDLQPVRKHMRIVTAISDHAATAYADLLDVWVVNAGITSPQIRQLAAGKGAEVWNYSCSNRGTANAPFQRFYAGIYTWALRLRGNFLWAYAEQFSWEGDWNAVHCYGLPSDNGPIPSIAWEARREGVEDYRLLTYLESLIALDPQHAEAKRARAWLEKIRGKVDWYLARHMPPSLYNLDGPELYPMCPNFEPAELAQVRAKALEYVIQLGAQNEKWTEAERRKGYVVFSHSTVERLPPSYVPARASIVKKVSCSLARAEYESLQIGIHAVAGDLKNIRLEVASDIAVEVYHGAQTRPAPETGVVWEGPDITLVRDGAIETLAGGKSINYWLTFHAGPQTPAGVHKGEIRIDVEGQAAAVVDLEVFVRPFQLHRPRIAFGLYFPYQDWPEHTRTDEQLIAVYRYLAEQGMNSTTFYDWTSWFNVSPDQRRVIRCLKLAKQAGLAHRDIPCLWLYGGGTMADQESRRKAVAWLQEESARNGWPEMVLYGSDEPPYPYPQLREQYLPWREIPIRIGTALDAKAAYGHSDLNDVWIVHCPVLTPEMNAEAARLGAQVWTYSCQIRSWELLRERYLTGIFTWANKVAGSFIWTGKAYAHQWWPEPGKPPLPIVGAEARREGVDDYRYLKMLEDCAAAKRGDPLATEAAEWLESLRTRYNMNPHEVEPGKPLAIAEYDRIRARAADYIERLGVVEEDRLTPPAVTHLKDEAGIYRGKPLEECAAGLADPHAQVRRSAAWALYERAEKAAPAAEALAGALDDAEVRMVALRALEAIGPKARTAVPKLAALQGHSDAFVRLGVTYALGAIGASAVEPSPAAADVLELLRGALQDDCPAVTYAAAQMLSGLGPIARGALPEMIGLLDHSDGYRRAAAFTFVASLGPQAVAAVPRLVEIVDGAKGKGTAELRCLAAIGPAAAEAIPILEKWARANPTNPDRGWIYYTLFCIRGETADLKNLVGMMADNDLPEPTQR